jgi:hypothetical protein
MKFEVPAVMNFQIMFFCSVTSYSLVESSQCSGDNLMVKRRWRQEVPPEC